MTTPSRTPVFTPSPGRLCVIPLEEESRSGLLIVRNSNEKPVTGRVSEIAPALALKVPYDEMVDRYNWNLQVGDTILFGSNSGLEIKVDGERRIILRESEVLAKVGYQEDAQLLSDTSRPGDCPACGVGLPNHAIGCTFDL